MPIEENIKTGSMYVIDFDPSIVGLSTDYPNLLAMDYTTRKIYFWDGPTDTDWSIAVTLPPISSVIMKSPGGSLFAISVSDQGELVVTPQ